MVARTKLGVKAQIELKEAQLLLKLCNKASSTRNTIKLDTKAQGVTKYSVVGKTSAGGTKTYYSVTYTEATQEYAVWVKGKKVSLGPKHSKRLFNFTKSQDERRKELEKSLVGEDKQWGLFSFLRRKRSK